MSKVTVVSRPNRITIASKGVQGAAGPEGPQGIQGEQGPPGATDPELRSDLADPTSGAELVAMKQAGATTYQRTVAAELLDRVSILRFIPPALHAGIRNGGGTTDLRAYVQNAVNYCVQNGRELYCPAGVYVIDPYSAPGGTHIQLNVLTAHGQGLRMVGEGRGRTIIKEAAGATAVGGRYTRIFYYHLNATSFRAGSFEFEGITFDKNGSSNGTPPSPYEWEQAHIITWAGAAGTPSIESITFRSCEFRDKVGACINLSSGPCVVKSIVIDDVQSVDHPKVATVGDGTFGQRACLEFGMDSEGIAISNTRARYAQIEPVLASGPDRRRAARVSNSFIDKVEFTDTGEYSELDVTNTRCPDYLYVAGMNSRISNCNFRVPTQGYSYAGGDLSFIGCAIILPYDSVTNSVTWMQHAPNSGNPGAASLVLVGCKFLIDSDSPEISPVGHALGGGTVGQLGGMSRRVIGCEFDKRLQRSIDAYRNGDWFIANCAISGSDYGVNVGGVSTNGGRVELRDNDFSAVTGAWVVVNRNNDLWGLQISGAYAADKWSWRNVGSGTVHISAFPSLYGASAPVSGYWYQGQSIRNTAAAAGGSFGWVRVASSNVSSGWRAYGAISA